MSTLTITSDLKKMDFSVIHGFLSNSYWAIGIPSETQQRALENSWCFALLNDKGDTIAFARLVTDRATFAYLADVFVVESERGKGISKMLVEHIMRQPEVQQMRRIMLATADAHSLYEKFGFAPVSQPEKLMQVHRPDIYAS